ASVPPPSTPSSLAFSRASHGTLPKPPPASMPTASPRIITSHCRLDTEHRISALQERGAFEPGKLGSTRTWGLGPGALGGDSDRASAPIERPPQAVHQRWRRGVAAARARCPFDQADRLGGGDER